MEKFFTVRSEKNYKISVEVVAGHFATSSAHRSHYIEIAELKSCVSAAKGAACELAIPYLSSELVDIIVYMDGTEIIAAYLADELLQEGVNVMNEGSEIHVVTPMIRADGHFIFHQSMHEKIKNKNVVLLVASMSTGATVNTILECLNYYGCNLVGISAIFSAVNDVNGKKINSLFTTEEIPDYHFYSTSECPMCKEGIKLDAVFSSEGYTKL